MSFPEIPDDDADFTPDLARKIIAKYHEILKDPVAVHLNMLRGGIARPSWQNLQHLYPQEFAAAPGHEVERLRKALSAAAGYLMNAKIDLDTGAPKRTAVRTIEGGLKMVNEALANADPGSELASQHLSPGESS